MLADNGTLILQQIGEKLSVYLQGHEIDEDTLLSFANEMSAKGLMQDTAYLYMQGHAVYDLICRIGISLFGPAFEQQILLPAFESSADYRELNQVRSDVNYILYASDVRL